MIYPFRCIRCGSEREVCMNPRDYDPEQRCDCGTPMVRVYTVPQVNVGAARTEYSKANEAYNRDPLRGNLVPLGHENPDPPPRQSNYEIKESDLRGYEALNALGN